MYGHIKKLVTPSIVRNPRSTFLFTLHDLNPKLYCLFLVGMLVIYSQVECMKIGWQKSPKLVVNYVSPHFHKNKKYVNMPG